MPKKISWSPLAEEDLESILGYLQTNWGNAASLKFLNVVDHLLSQIANNHRQFPLINKKHRIRKAVLSKHNSLYYKNARSHIYLLRIYDNRQDPKKLKFV